HSSLTASSTRSSSTFSNPASAAEKIRPLVRTRPRHNFRFVNPAVSAAALIFTFVLFGFPASAQALPDKIRGYKVHKESIVIRPGTESERAKVTPGEPEAVEIGLTGLTLEI